jgi:hypothetical protein
LTGDSQTSRDIVPSALRYRLEVAVEAPGTSVLAAGL